MQRMGYLQLYNQYMQEVSGEQEEIAEHLLFDCKALYTCFRFYLSIRRRS